MVVRGLSLRRQILCLALGLAAALLCLLLFTYYHLERNKVTEQYVRHWLVDSGRFSAASEILHTRDSRAARTLLNQVMTVPDVEYTALIQPSGEHFAEAGFSPTNPTALELVAVRSNLDAEQQSYFCFNGRFYFLQRLQAQHTHQGSLLSVSSMHLPLAQLRHRMWGILVFALAALGVFALFFDQWLRRRCAPLEQLLVKLSGRTLTAPVLCAAEVAQVEQTLMCSDTIARERELQLQEQLRAATEKAREQAKFVAIVSHEIRTPMNGVLGMIELLQSTALSEEQCKFVEAVSRSGKSLLQVVDDVLDYTKLEGGKLVLEQVDFDLCEQIERVFEMLGQQGRKKSLQLDYHLDPGFSGWLHGDPLRMRQVLMNLVDNAIKFTHIGKVSIAVELIDQDTPKLRVSVSDTGPGIAQEAQASIF
ncbi:MAG: sensor histidine kinase, partial [Pseudomonadales bacterium]